MPCPIYLICKYLTANTFFFSNLKNCFCVNQTLLATTKRKTRKVVPLEDSRGHQRFSCDCLDMHLSLPLHSFFTLINIACFKTMSVLMFGPLSGIKQHKSSLMPPSVITSSPGREAVVSYNRTFKRLNVQLLVRWCICVDVFFNA